MRKNASFPQCFSLNGSLKNTNTVVFNLSSLLTLGITNSDTTMSYIYPNSAGTLRSESETERKPEVPAATRGEALFRCPRPSGHPHCIP